MVPMDQCHIDPVYKTIWLNAKQGNEFFTGSTDGTVSWIPTRRYFKYLFIYLSICFANLTNADLFYRQLKSKKSNS
jgi:hypothetical protein